LIVEYLPKGSPDLSALKECWRREGKDDLLVSKLSQVCKTKNSSYYKLL
jgi:hypothetical protein